MSSRIEQLSKHGQSVWLDFIRRGHMISGEFDEMVRQGVVGVTSNPTIFQQAVTTSDDYDTMLERGVAKGLAATELFDDLAIEDIQMACDKLKPVFERTGGVDGRVSIEVNPHLAHDTEGTLNAARRYAREVARPNLMVKIPATREGLPAVSAALADGICINVTLIFTLARYEEVMDAYLTGLERRARENQPIDGLHSVASFFVSRVDSKVDKAIAAAAADLPANDPRRTELESLKGRSAVANARLAYARFKEVFATERFKTLAAQGGRAQRPLWASTGTKDPAYPDTLYVDELVGDQTVNTIPPKTLAAFIDHGDPTPAIEKDLAQARAVFTRLPELGIPLGALIAELEPEGVTAFQKSYDALIEAIEARRANLSTGGAR